MKNHLYEIRMSSVGISVCMLLFGIVLALYPEMSGIIFTRAFATVLLLFALFYLWRWNRERKYGGGKAEMTGMIALFVLSGIGFFMPEVVLSFLPFVAGAILLLDGLIKISLLRDLWNFGGRLRGATAMSVFLPLIFGIILVGYPFGAVAMVIRLFGIFLIVDSGSDILRTVLVKKYGD